MIPLSVPSLRGNELRYLTECIESEWVSSAGPFVTRFERAIAGYCGSAHAVACTSGTAALHVALLLCGVRPDDEVMVPTLTFIAPVNAVRYVGAYPVFMDCDDHLNLDPSKLETFLDRECERTARGLCNRQTGRRVSAILVVHVFGHLADMDALSALSRRYELPLVEDATEALGSVHVAADGTRRHAGTIGDIGCLSFNGNKIITTGGGGMILTADERHAARARYLTTQAKDDPDRFVHHEIGFNYRLTNVAAAIGCAQVERLEDFVARKRATAAAYREALETVPGLRLIEQPRHSRSNFWFDTLVVDAAAYGATAEHLMAKLAERRIEARMIWELVHLQRPYQSCQRYQIERAPAYQQRCLNLPCSVSLEPGTVAEICEVVRSGQACGAS